MDISLTRSDAVYSQDGKMLGNPLFVAHRLDGDEINPELDLYPAHVRIVSRSLGTNFHVPTAFFANRDEANSNVTLALTENQVLHYWMRLPDFVARGNFRREDLPEN
jgi:hypothetical protein